jgi:hypothetical protein
MSILEIPRIYFSGEISWDPVTTNNYPKNYNEDACETVFTKGEDVAAFRQSAIDQITTDGNWDPDGTYRSTYFNTFISGVDTGSGLNTDDPFTKAPVNFTGMLVDSEPYGAYSSQLFFDDMSFGIDGGCRIYGKRVTRFTDRYINFGQNPANDMIAGIASVMWQTCFPKDQGLVIDAHDSPALQALKAHMDDDDVLGVMVRWDSYRTVYYDDPTLSNTSPATTDAGKALQDKMNGGGFQPNPARSLIVGSVGLWRRDDPIHEAGDRALITSSVSVNAAGAVAGSAFALVSEDRITLDLSNCIPDANRTPEKVDLGDLTLTAADPAPAVAILDLATIPFSQYNQAAYQATSGIIDIPIDKGMAQTLATMDLKLTSAKGSMDLSEVALRAVPSDPNLYMNQGETVTTKVQVYHRGKPAGPDIMVTMAKIGGIHAIAHTQTTDNTGVASFSLTGAQGAVTGYALLPGDNPQVPVTNNDFNTLTETYMYVRVLPADADIAVLEPTWANVQDKVLGNWQAMAPCMDNWLDLGSAVQVKAYGGIIKKLTDPANFEAYRYMPVTRDMTPGQRTLLYNFLDGTTVTPVIAARKAKEKKKDFASLNKSMRTPVMKR